MLGHPSGANQVGCGLLYHRRLPFDDPWDRMRRCWGIWKCECRKMSAQKEEEQTGGTQLRIRGWAVKLPGHHRRLREFNAGPVVGISYSKSSNELSTGWRSGKENLTNRQLSLICKEVMRRERSLPLVLEDKEEGRREDKKSASLLSTLKCLLNKVSSVF